MTLTTLEAPERDRIPPHTIRLFALGFRPFYLLAALVAIITVPFWAVAFSGLIRPPAAGIGWHAHEMLFGFAGAVIIGFLYTAARNWTGLMTPHGAVLIGLAALWLAGRLAMGLGNGLWAAVTDFLFLPLASIALLQVLIRAKSRRNYFIGVLPLLLSLTNLFYHLAASGMIDLDPLLPLHAALALIVVLETIISGRIVPMFTTNALKINVWRNRRLEYAVLASTIAALAAWVASAGIWTMGLLLVAAVLHLIRSIGWRPWATRYTPLLWILHLSCLWIPVGLILLAAAQAGWTAPSAGIHALAIGATGGLIIGMITRTALGHTGRLLVAGKAEAVSYVLVQLAAIVRVVSIVALPSAYIAGIHLAALLWTVAFIVYLWRYFPILIYARADGRAD